MTSVGKAIYFSKHASGSIQDKTIFHNNLEKLKEIPGKRWGAQSD